MLAGLTACAAPAYNYVSDSADNAYFKVPAGWAQVGPQTLLNFQSQLGTSLAGSQGGPIAWTRAYAAAAHPSAAELLLSSRDPVVYASVHDLPGSARDAMSFNEMRDMIFYITPGARQQAIAAGRKLPAYKLLVDDTITDKDGVHGINELYLFSFRGQVIAYDQTVLTNNSTTKLYLLLVQCEQHCFLSHLAQIKTVVQSFTVRGS
jgi:hypothetical protein